MARKILLVCGILSSLLYVVMDVLAGMRYEGYSFASRTISELSAIGAPTRPLWLALGPVYQVLATLFGWGVWVSGGRHRALRVVGGLLIGYGLLGFAAPIFPMHRREFLAAAGPALTDTMHKILTLAAVLLMLSAIGFGAAAFGTRFRIYSIATIVVLLVFGTLAGLDGPRIEANLPTPWVGVTERIDIGVFLLWVVVLAIALLRVPEAVAGREGSR